MTQKLAVHVPSVSRSKVFTEPPDFVLTGLHTRVRAHRIEVKNPRNEVLDLQGRIFSSFFSFSSISRTENQITHIEDCGLRLSEYPDDSTMRSYPSTL